MAADTIALNICDQKTLTVLSRYEGQSDSFTIGDLVNSVGFEVTDKKGGDILEHNLIVTSNASGQGYIDVNTLDVVSKFHALYKYEEPEIVTGFFLDGQQYKIGGAEYHAGEGISVGDASMNARKGPSPDGFHVPSTTEWQGLKTIMDGLSLTTGNNWKINLHMPFAGFRNGLDASVDGQGSYGYYWSSSPYSAGSSSFNARSLHFGSSNVDAYDYSSRGDGYSLRCFKDSYVTPTSSWTVVQGTLGSAGIFRDQINGLISITSDGSTGYTIMDKNLGATTVYNNGDTLSQANMGNMYQWGNNYGFPSTGTITNISSTQVDASSYGPTNPYSSNTFITTGSGDWSSVRNNDLWGDTTGTITQENVISNTGVLSVNGQTGDVTVNVPTDYVNLTTNQTITGLKAFSGVNVNIDNGDLEVFDSDPGQFGLISDWITISADKITAHDSPDVEYTFTGSGSTKIARLGDLSGYIPYSDFNWQTKTGATFTLDLASTITPSANFTVNAPATLKDGQTYILRVNNGATAYTMTLGTGITNPFGTSLALTANGVDQFVFLAIGGDLELQPEIEGGSGGVTSVNGQTGAVTVQETLTSGTNIKTINSTSLLGSGNIAVQASLSNITAAEIKTGTATTQRSVTAAALAGGLVRISDQANNILANGGKLWAGTQANYEALSSYDSNTVYLTV